MNITAHQIEIAIKESEEFMAQNKEDNKMENPSMERGRGKLINEPSR